MTIDFLDGCSAPIFGRPQPVGTKELRYDFPKIADVMAPQPHPQLNLNAVTIHKYSAGKSAHQLKYKEGSDLPSFQSKTSALQYKPHRVLLYVFHASSAPSIFDPSHP